MASGDLTTEAVFGAEDDELEVELDVARFNRESPYNRPGFKPSHIELSHAPVEIVGELPDDLEGVYIRNGTNPQFADQRVRYHMFDGAEERDGYMGKGVLKYDLDREEEVDYFDYGDLYGGEPLFVSNENPKNEDDGYLLDLLMGVDEAALIVIDAATMQEVARLLLPQRVPFGVHACWLDTSRLDVMAVQG